jgi:hypothetical protein
MMRERYLPVQNRELSNLELKSITGGDGPNPQAASGQAALLVGSVLAGPTTVGATSTIMQGSLTYNLAYAWALVNSAIDNLKPKP